MDICHSCNRPYEVWKSTREHPYLYTESGLSQVQLGGVTVYSCPSCNIQSADIPDMDGLHLLLAKELIVRPIAMSGEELRFLRKETRMTPKTFAERVGVDPKTVSNWENAEELSKQTDIALRFVIASELFRDKELDGVLEALSENVKFSWEPGRAQDESAAGMRELMEFNTIYGLGTPEWQTA